MKSRINPTSLLIVIIFTAFSSFQYLAAQKQVAWFDFGLKGQIGGSVLYNSTVANVSDYNYEVMYTNSYAVGAKLGMNFGYNGISLDVMYNKGQSVYDRPASFGEGLSTIDWNSINGYLLFRNAKNLGYFELGPMFSLIQDVKSTRQEFSRDDVSNYNVSAVLGFGVNLIGDDEGRFSGILGIRLEYGLLDFSNETGELRSAPLYDSNLFRDGYTSSHPVFAGIVFELNWGVGYFGKAQCGARSKFIMF